MTARQDLARRDRIQELEAQAANLTAGRDEDEDKAERDAARAARLKEWKRHQDRA